MEKTIRLRPGIQRSKATTTVPISTAPTASPTMETLEPNDMLVDAEGGPKHPACGTNKWRAAALSLLLVSIIEAVLICSAIYASHLRCF